MQEDRFQKRQNLIPNLYNFRIPLGLAGHTRKSPCTMFEREEGLDALVQGSGCEEGRNGLEGVCIGRCSGEDLFGEG